MLVDRVRTSFVKCSGRTRRCIRVILWEVHLGLKISAVVERVRVEDDESNVPIKDIIVMELKTYSSVTVGCEVAGQRSLPH